MDIEYNSTTIKHFNKDTLVKQFFYTLDDTLKVPYKSDETHHYGLYPLQILDKKKINTLGLIAKDEKVYSTIHSHMYSGENEINSQVFKLKKDQYATFENNTLSLYEITSDSLMSRVVLSDDYTCEAVLDFRFENEVTVFVLNGNLLGKSSIRIVEVDSAGRIRESTVNTLDAASNITDGIITNVNHDDYYDVVLVGLWMSPLWIKRTETGFEKLEVELENQLTGHWRFIKAIDYNQDGYSDYILGNIGVNNRLAAFGHLAYYCNMDIDKNGDKETILGFQISKHKEHSTYHTLDDLTARLPLLKDKFQKYSDFGALSYSGLLKELNIPRDSLLNIDEFASVLLLNKGGQSFKKILLPNAFQMGPLNDVVVLDVNQDGKLDIIGIGNDYTGESNAGRHDALLPMLALGEGNGNFVSIPSAESGLTVSGDLRKIVADHNDLIILSADHRIYKYKHIQ